MAACARGTHRRAPPPSCLPWLRRNGRWQNGSSTQANALVYKYIHQCMSPPFKPMQCVCMPLLHSSKPHSSNQPPIRPASLPSVWPSSHTADPSFIKPFIYEATHPSSKSSMRLVHKHIHTHLRTYPPTHLPTYLPTYLPTLPIYMSYISLFLLYVAGPVLDSISIS